MKSRVFLTFLSAATVLTTFSNLSYSSVWISAANADTVGRSSLFDSKFKFKKKSQSGSSNIYKQKKDAFDKRQKKIDSFRSQCEAKAKSSAELYDCSFSDGTTETIDQENSSRSPGPRRTSPTTTKRPASSTKRPASSTTRPASSNTRPASSTTRPASSTQSGDIKSTNSNSKDPLDTSLDKMIDDIYNDVFSN